MEFSNEKLKTLKNYLLQAKCSRHPDYPLRYFCQVRKCSHGLMCEVCEEQEHGHLRHQDLTCEGVGNLIDLEHFADSLFDGGLFYEVGKDLHSIFKFSDIKSLLIEKVHQTEDYEYAMSGFEKRFQSYSESLTTLLETKLLNLKQKLSSEIEKVYQTNIAVLEDYVRITTELKKKRDTSFMIVSREIDSSKKSKDPLDTETLSLSLQTYLECTFTDPDRILINGVKEAAKFIDNHLISPKADFSKMKSNFEDAKQDLIHTINKIQQEVVKEPGVNIAQYLDTLGKMDNRALFEIKIVGRVQVALEDKVTAVCLMDEKHLAVGYNSGKINLYDQKVLNQEYTQGTLPLAFFSTEDVVHRAAIGQMLFYERASDKMGVVIASDNKGTISIHCFNASQRSLEYQYKLERIHFYPIKLLQSISKSNFILTFARGEKLKVWNTKEGFLSTQLEGVQVDFDVSVCLFRGDQKIAILRQNSELEIFEFNFTNYSKNFEIQRPQQKKRVFNFTLASLEVSSMNHAEVPYLAVIGHNYKRVHLKVLHSQSLEIILRINNDFSELSSGAHLSDCFLSIAYVEAAKKLPKFKPKPFIREMRVVAYDTSRRALMVFKEQAGDLTSVKSIAQMGYSGGLILEPHGSSGDFLSVGAASETIINHNLTRQLTKKKPPKYKSAVE